MAARVGGRDYLHSTALGKAILAFLPPAERDHLLHAPGGLPARTERTITDPAKLRAELERVRERGIAEDRDENEVGARCLGAPIFDHRGVVAGAISVSAPDSRLDDARAAEVAVAVREEAAAITRASRRSHRAAYRSRGSATACVSVSSAAQSDLGSPGRPIAGRDSSPASSRMTPSSGGSLEQKRVPMRLIAGGIMHETHTFSAEPTTLESLSVVARGEELLAFAGRNHSLGGVDRRLPRARHRAGAGVLRRWRLDRHPRPPDVRNPRRRALRSASPPHCRRTASCSPCTGRWWPRISRRRGRDRAPRARPRRTGYADRRHPRSARQYRAGDGRSGSTSSPPTTPTRMSMPPSARGRRSICWRARSGVRSGRRWRSPNRR